MGAKKKKSTAKGYVMCSTEVFFTEKMQQKEVKSLVFTNTKIGINLEHPREESTYRWIHEP